MNDREMMVAIIAAFLAWAIVIAWIVTAVIAWT